MNCSPHMLLGSLSGHAAAMALIASLNGDSRSRKCIHRFRPVTQSETNKDVGSWSWEPLSSTLMSVESAPQLLSNLFSSAGLPHRRSSGPGADRDTDANPLPRRKDEAVGPRARRTRRLLARLRHPHPDIWGAPGDL